MSDNVSEIPSSERPLGKKKPGLPPHKRLLSNWRRLLRHPWLELNGLVVLAAISSVAIFLIGRLNDHPPDGMTGAAITAWLVGFFLISFSIAIVAVMGGVGGGVLFTPIMLAFTSVDSLVIRGAGLVVAMVSGLVSTGPFMRSGLSNLRVCVFLCSAFGTGAFLGAQGAVYLADTLGLAGEGLTRLSLGIILFFVILYFLFCGKGTEWPVVKHVDSLSQWLNLRRSYYEPTLKKTVDYPVAHALSGLVVFLFIGMVSGFYGLGAGWAIVPAQNFIMGIPLKVSAANSGVILGMGGAPSVWPYIHRGAIIPLFVAPWLTGRIVGSMVGAQLLIRVKSSFVRYLLIAILGFACYGLSARGLFMLGLVGESPVWLTALVFVTFVGGVAWIALWVENVKGR